MSDATPAALAALDNDPTRNPMCKCGQPFSAHYTDGRGYFCTNPHAWVDGEAAPRFRFSFTDAPPQED